MVSSYMKTMIIGGLLATVLHSPAAPQSPTVAGIRLLGSELQTARDVSARKKAAEGLGRASTPLSVALLRRARTAERDVQVRLEIVRALRRIAFQRYSGYRDALRGIAEAADDNQESDALVRLRATEALWEAGKKDLLDLYWRGPLCDSIGTAKGVSFGPGFWNRISGRGSTEAPTVSGSNNPPRNDTTTEFQLKLLFSKKFSIMINSEKIFL